MARLARYPLSALLLVAALTAATLPRSAAATRPRLQMGMSIHGLPAMSPVELSQALTDAAAIGVTWVRVDLDWATIQPTSSASWTWTAFDRVVSAAHAHHLTLLPILDYTPAWARQPACAPSEFCAPADKAAFARFAARAVQRYGSQGIHTWEIWNEPNSAFWQPSPNAAAYAALLSAAAPAMRQVDPSAYIISGGLAPAVTMPGAVAPRDYLAALCEAGGLAYVDAVGDHPYSFPVSPGDQVDWNAWAEMGSTQVSLESILASCGAANKPIWATEYGAPTNGPGATATASNPNLAAHPDHVDEAYQAELATESVQLANAAPYVAALFWYTHQDTATVPVNNEGFFGIRRQNGTPKPTLGALQRAIANLG